MLRRNVIRMENNVKGEVIHQHLVRVSGVMWCSEKWKCHHDTSRLLSVRRVVTRFFSLAFALIYLFRHIMLPTPSYSTSTIIY